MPHNLNLGVKCITVGFNYIDGPFNEGGGRECFLENESFQLTNNFGRCGAPSGEFGQP